MARREGKHEDADGVSDKQYADCGMKIEELNF